MDFDLKQVWPDWEIKRLIGEGSFGKVYEIARNNFGIEEHCALKVISIPQSQAEIKSIRTDGMDDASITDYYRGIVDDFVQEIALMSKLKGHSNIVGYEDYAVVEHEDSVGWDILIRMELLTDLTSYLQNHSMNEKEVIKLAIDICEALEICHKQKIIHRDLKIDNIFISSNNSFKLGDFGVARNVEKTLSGLSKKGTYTYMAPEVYKGDDYNSNIDLYSLGIVMYKLLNNNREPFLPSYPNPIKYSDRNNALVRRMKGETILPPKNASREISDIILKACSYNSTSRYQHPSEMKADLMAVYNLKDNTEDKVEEIITITPPEAESMELNETERTVCLFASDEKKEKAENFRKKYSFNETPDTSVSQEKLEKTMGPDLSENNSSQSNNIPKTPIDNPPPPPTDFNANMNLVISKEEAATGCKKKIFVPHLNKSYTVTVPMKTHDGSCLRLKGQGNFDRKTGEQGDLLLYIRVTNSGKSPTSLNNSKKDNNNSIQIMRIIALSLGFSGAVIFNVVWMVYLSPVFTFIMFAMLINMTIASSPLISNNSVRKLKASAIVMLVLSALTLNIFNLASAILLLIIYKKSY